MTALLAPTSAPAHACAQGVDLGFTALGPLKVAFLGIVQGITELLPVSSTAHMRAVPAFLGWPDPGSAFSAAMQLAALLAVVTFFRADISRMVFGSIVAIRRTDWRDPELRLGLGILLATVPIALAGALLSPVLNACSSPLRSPFVVGIACVAMAGLMAIAEWFAGHRRAAGSLTLVDALLIGIGQVGALVPGVSRSGSTFATALALGFKRDDAARISFLLGIPAIALAGLHELWVLWRADLSLDGWETLGIGLATASLASFAAIWGLLRFLERHSSWPLIIYRAAFGLALLLQTVALRHS